MNAYMIVLTGGGDLSINVVDEETFNWITSDDQGQSDPAKEGDSEYYWQDQLVPKSQIEKMKIKYEEDYEPLMISSGSWDNDRALAACCADGYPSVYTSVYEAVKAISNRGDTLIEEYHGCIY